MQVHQNFLQVRLQQRPVHRGLDPDQASPAALDRQKRLLLLLLLQSFSSLLLWSPLGANTDTTLLETQTWLVKGLWCSETPL